MIPTECKMPDLADCLAVRLQVQSMLHAFIGDPGINRREGSYRRNFARLIDKALYEYQSAREAILAQVAEAGRSHKQMADEGRQIFIFDYVNHFENCVNAINRALHLLERLKGEAILSDLPREVRRSLDAYSRSLRDLRNAVEHVDELIRKDEIAEGQPVMLSIGGDGDRAVIGAYEVRFVDVARLLRKLHGIGQLMFDVERPRPSPGGGPVPPGGGSLGQ